MAWLVALGLMLMGLAAPAAADMPAVVIARGNLVTPAAALSYYGTPTSPTPPASRDPLVQEAARSLRYDIDAIYAYVRDNVDFVPMFGLLKGSRGVVLDGAGTAFDQAQFMVDALREADAVAGTGYNPVYKLGQITLGASDFASWTGVADADRARKVLANGGIPATVTGSGASFTVTMTHIWVQVTIGGTAYLFDPSFKRHMSVAAGDWITGSGYSPTALLSAGGGGTGTTISGFNVTAFRNTLKTYRTNIETALNAAVPGGRADAAIGSFDIVAHDASENRRTALPYASATDRSWTGQVPAIFRTAFTVSLNGTAYGTYYADEVAGMVYAFNFNLNSAQTGFVIGPVTANITVASAISPCNYSLDQQPAVTPAVVTIAINHPYADASGTYLDRTLTKPIVSRKCSSGNFYVSNDWGVIGDGLSRRLREAGLVLRRGPGASNRLIIAPTIEAVPKQFSNLLDTTYHQKGDIYQVHDLIGVHGVDAVSYTYSNNDYAQVDPAAMILLDYEAAVSANSASGSVADETGAAYVAGLGLSLAEGASPRQENDTVYDMAAIHLLLEQDSRASSPGTYPTYLATPATWASVKTNLSSDYPAAAVTAIGSYVAEGYSVLVPQHGALQRPTITVPAVSGTSSSDLGESTDIPTPIYKRSAFLAWRPNASNQSIPDRVALVTYDTRHARPVKGGTSTPTTTNLGTIRPPDQPAPAIIKSIRSGIGVSRESGKLTYNPPPDLVDGSGDFPRSLSLQRAFDQDEPANQGLGIGWKTNWYQVATLSNDGEGPLGGGGAQQLASTLLTIQALRDLAATQDAQHLYASVQALSWLGDQTLNNLVMVTKGLDGDQRFYRMADGSFVSGNGDGTKLVQSGSTPIVSIINRWRYDGTYFAFTDKAGSVRNYLTTPASTDPGLTSSPSIASGLSIKQAYMLDWTFPSGIVVTTRYNGPPQSPDITFVERISNNLGAQISYVSYDLGSLLEKPVCDQPLQPPVYYPPFDGHITYRSSSGAVVTFYKTAEASWIVDPKAGENPKCDRYGIIPLIQTSYASYAKSVTDAAGQSWTYSRTTVPGLYAPRSTLAGIFAPDDVASPVVTVGYGVDGGVREVSDKNGHAYGYYFNAYRRESVTASQAGAGKGTVEGYDRHGNRTSVTDALQRVTGYSYDNRSRLVTTTYPELNTVTLEYDARGNVVRQTQAAKPGSGLASIVTSTAYMEGASVWPCVRPKTCNQPLYEIDGRGYRTGYTYCMPSNADCTLDIGAVRTVTTGLGGSGSCALTGGACPVTTYGYSVFTAADATSFYLPTSQQDRLSASASRTTSWGYDASNHWAMREELQDVGGLALRSCFSFDASGNLISRTTPNANATICP